MCVWFTNRLVKTEGKPALGEILRPVVNTAGNFVSLQANKGQMMND